MLADDMINQRVSEGGPEGLVKVKLLYYYCAAGGCQW